MENVSKTIKRHNKRVTKINERFVAPRNYRDNCPMNGSCRVQKVVYIHVVSVTEKSKEHAYTKVAEGNWNCATTIIPWHSEIRDTKMTQLFQVFYGSLKNH